MGWYEITFSGVIGLWALSYVIEALRREPGAPEKISWATDVQVSWVTVDGLRLRYIETGSGPTIVLLHTLRTQLDLFRKVVGELSRDYRLITVDYPGHGYSDIPEADYDPELFARSVRGFLHELDIRDAVIVGESIGGTLGLLLAAEHNPRIRKVIAINSYDYDQGRGITRGSVISRLTFAITGVPILGGMVWRMRWKGAFATIIKGSVHDDESLPPDLVHEMHLVGNRRRHYAAFMSLVAHFPQWEDLRRQYGRIEIPVLLVYGEHDWSHPWEREANQRLIPGADMVSVPRAGHLLSLDNPEGTIGAVRRFAT
jgi:pimeloyl-ACP methyl ester carboxylesterase